jgi:hypothetical protein
MAVVLVSPFLRGKQKLEAAFPMLRDEPKGENK